MNVRFKYSLPFRAGYWSDDYFRMNLYTVSMTMITATSASEDHLTAMGRIQHLFDSLDSVVFIEHSNTEKIEALNNVGITAIALPEYPVDQIVGIVLFKKLNAILEGRVRVTDLSISSELGDDIEFLHSENEIIPTLADSGWWTDASPRLSDTVKGTQRQNVVKIKKLSSWKSLDLVWSDQDGEHSTETLIFNRKDDS